MNTQQQDDSTTTAQQTGYRIGRYKGHRYWAVVDPAGALVCLTVYKRGAEEVVRRLCA
jgi:hypothetical protein